LRHALESSHWPWVDLATELAGLEAYLAIQQTRFSDRLSISIDASPESLGAYVPSLLLQPLAENAIQHGRNEGGPTLHVRVTAAVVAERLLIVVNNSSPQLPGDLAPADYGHGLSNVKLRLHAATVTTRVSPSVPTARAAPAPGSTCPCAAAPARRSPRRRPQRHERQHRNAGGGRRAAGAPARDAAAARRSRHQHRGHLRLGDRSCGTGARARPAADAARHPHARARRLRAGGEARRTGAASL